MNRIFKIRIPGYKEHQKNIKQRRYVAMDSDFFSNPKVREAKRRCLDAGYCFQWLWFNVDYETEALLIKEASLKFEWMDVCAATSNRFDLIKRLEVLSESGLIEFTILEDDARPVQNLFKTGHLLQVEHHPKVVLTSSQCDPNVVLKSFQDPLEQAQTHVAVISSNTNKLNREEETKEKNTQKNEAAPPSLGLFDSFWTIYPKKVAKCKIEALWKSRKLDAIAPAIIEAVQRYSRTEQWQKDKGRYVPNPETFLNQKRWEDEIETTIKPAKPMPSKPASLAAWERGESLEGVYDGKVFEAQKLELYDTVRQKRNPERPDGFIATDGTTGVFNYFRPTGRR